MSASTPTPTPMAMAMAMAILTPETVNQMVEQRWSDSRYECTAVSTEHAQVSLALAGMSLRPGGYVPGPTQFAMADVVLWYLSFGVLDRVEPMSLTSELSIRFLRPCVGTTLKARATLDRAGKRSMVGTVRVWADNNENKPSATAQGTYALPGKN
jgi:acyl-coenzyme A thioesterase PaaI-like protein